jgi:HD-GYP domain-containing protein (c-di-GMP phosphodiesterase class II)
MTGGEPGQDAMSREEAAEELKRNAGARFDPEIVKLFIEKALPKIE